MTNHIISSEETVQQLVGTELGEKYSLATSLSEISEIPIDDFSDLQGQVSLGKATIRMAPGGIDGTTFNILSATKDEYLGFLYMAVTYIGPIVGVILGFMYSWIWLIVLVAAPVIGMRLHKRLYLNVLFRAAFHSEVLFSYLFTAGKITVELPEYGILRRKLA